MAMQSLQTAIARTASGPREELPEYRLLMAVIVLAVKDARQGKRSARRFLNSQDYHELADVLGLSDGARARIAGAYDRRKHKTLKIQRKRVK